MIPATSASAPATKRLAQYPPLQAAYPSIIPSIGLLPIEANTTPPNVRVRITPASDITLAFTHANINTAVTTPLGAFNKYFLITESKKPVSSTTPIAIIIIRTSFKDGKFT